MNKREKRKGLFAAAMVGAILIAAGFLYPSVQVAASNPEAQNMVGVWDGFWQAGADPPDPVRTEFTAQQDRRFTGFINPPEPVQPISIEGTVSASGKVNIHGRSLDGSHMVGKTELLDFGGGGAILNGSFTLPSISDRFIVPCILVMRPFAVHGAAVPDAAGNYSGTFSTDQTNGRINLLLANQDRLRPTSFGGSIEIVLDGQPHTLQMLGTINGSGRVAGIAHRSGSGHMIVDAVLTPAGDGAPATLKGTFHFELEHGIEHEGTFEAPFAPPHAT